MNILVNAEYSIKKARGQGRLTITTKKDGDFISILFKDDGQGMSEEILSKLFHPFFTTKDPGEGTGLGLSLSHSIIIEHGGTIKAKSEPGQGATFIIKLPITPRAEVPVVQASVETSVKKASARKASILVIDDESAVRALIKRDLALNGHTVEEAGKPAQALEKLERSKYDIILLDMRMPGISGKELYAKIIGKWPEMAQHVIFITGDASDASTLQFFKEHNLPFITKPFDNSAMLLEIDKILWHN